MKEPYYHPHKTLYRNLSKRQRLAIINDQVIIPKHLIHMLVSQTSMFRTTFDLMVKGKVTFDTDYLIELLEIVHEEFCVLYKQDTGTDFPEDI